MRSKKTKVSLFIWLIVAVALVFGLAGCGQTGEDTADTSDDGSGQAAEDTADASSDEEADDAAKTYKMALCNSFMGNDWRQIMEKVAVLAAENPYYSDQVTLDIYNTEHTAEAQIASIDALIQQDYDALLIDAQSPTAIDPALERATEAGVLVVIFDQVVDTDEYYKIETDWVYVAETSAKFICEALNGKGNVVVDRGLSGSAIAQVLYDKAVAVFDQYEGIKIVAEFEGEFAEGPTEAGVAAAMTANPQIDAVYSQGYISCIADAFVNAGRDIPVITGGNYNSSGQSMLEYGYDCLAWQCNLAGMSAMAMDTAIKILDGETPDEKHMVIQDAQFVSTRTDLADTIGVTLAEVEDGVNTFSQYPPSFSWPVLPADFPIQVEPEDVLVGEDD